MDRQSIQKIHSDISKQLFVICEQYRVAEQEAWWMLEGVTQKKRAYLLTQVIQNASIITPQQQKTLADWIRQRVDEKKPLQYILGTVLFCDLEIIVEPPVLIPRPETEEMVLWLIDRIKNNNSHSLSILDLCTGTGCIGLALARAFPDSKVTALDISSYAVDLAIKNKLKNNIDNISIIKSDLYEELEANHIFDLIVSNPPYLSLESYEEVSDEIRLWEDKSALVADCVGMDIYKKIVSQSLKHLKGPNSMVRLVLEIGRDQKDIEKMLVGAGFGDVEVFCDMRGLRRWVAASI